MFLTSLEVLFILQFLKKYYAYVNTLTDRKNKKVFFHGITVLKDQTV